MMVIKVTAKFVDAVQFVLKYSLNTDSSDASGNDGH